MTIVKAAKTASAIALATALISAGTLISGTSAAQAHHYGAKKYSDYAATKKAPRYKKSSRGYRKSGWYKSRKRRAPKCNTW